MTRRTLVVIVAVAAVAVLLFALPLAYEVARVDHAGAVLTLERDATRGALQVPADYLSSGDPVELPATGAGTRLALYAPDATRVVGSGPGRLEPVATGALKGSVTDLTEHGEIIVVVPVTVNERVIGAIRAASPLADLRTATLHRWLLMGALGLGAIAVAALVGWRQARRLTAPVASLADAARRLGEGDFGARAQPAGIPELDRAAHSLNETAARLDALVSRERAFTADASHQLATPLTRLRLALERAEQATDPHDQLRRALHHADALEDTMDDLLALARDVHESREPLDVAGVLDELTADWHGQLAQHGRPLRVTADPDLPVAVASRAAVRQILEVLIANAAQHGTGTVGVHARAAGHGIAINVSDTGRAVLDDAVFTRRSTGAQGTGIGLALARSLAHAEGGRLVLSRPGPGPTFTLLLPGE